MPVVQVSRSAWESGSGPPKATTLADLLRAGEDGGWQGGYPQADGEESDPELAAALAASLQTAKVEANPQPDRLSPGWVLKT